MRVLFTTVPLHGHFFPMVPLAHALRTAGHDVLVAAPVNFTGVITEAGLPAVPTAPPLNFAEIMIKDRNGRPVAPAKSAAERHEIAGRAWGRLTARTLQRTLDVVDRWRPDIIVSEPSEHAGALAAASRGIPWIEHGWGISTMPECRPPAADELAAELSGLGLTALPEPDLHLHVCPPSMQRPHAPGSRNQRMRYVPYNGPATLPDWSLAERDRPRICLTFGSILPRFGSGDFRGLLTRIATALPGLGTDLVVGVEEQIAAAWQPLPPGVRSAGWLPLSLVAPSCDLIVHHGGSGSTLTALAAGLPQLALPQTADQFDNAACISVLGAGRQLLDDVTVEAILAACRELLTDPGYRKHAAALAAENASQPTPAEVVEVLHELTSTLV
ncbi:nucleotide disphospho-sugar-binding domain-containing protein [Protofrankia symbiont of Coriaria ruscifolia]|uniref:Uncharacterized protein n=1 Tax=Candidatus Protofrankia californiensis TaxID=1839754 RepID=A0A1C3NU86_9ACTN|nr:nucleotide disphospho-sugar-binding domain-containing protein [Protofrankia symbiont of Coriaria ruscifolia]SBW18681.1 protein of unknown function DUF1205 [Candidatus Protofrankia californiensis]